MCLQGLRLFLSLQPLRVPLHPSFCHDDKVGETEKIFGASYEVSPASAAVQELAKATTSERDLDRRETN